MFKALPIKSPNNIRLETFARCHERRQDAAKTDEKAEFIAINEHFESVFNKVLVSAVVVQKSH